MFERFTEKARRVIFFVRYEASAYGSPFIETEHLLLGLLRQSADLERHLRQSASRDSIRQENRGTHHQAGTNFHFNRDTADSRQ